jgi:GNAT superfamily N-acetyltransferase
MDLAALAQAVITQRTGRMTDAGPPLRGIGSARFHHGAGVLIVADARPRLGKADELVRRIVRFAQERWMSVSWTYLPGHDDPAVGEALLRQRFIRRESLRLMGRIGSLVPPLLPSPGVRVTPIRTLEEMMAYERISNWGFNHNQFPMQEHVRMRARERMEEQQAQWYYYYLGWLNGEPVGGAYVSLWETVPTIYGVVTTPPARGHGVAGQVMKQLVDDTLARGFEWTCLYVAAGNPAERLYRALGYEVLLEQDTYDWQEGS